MRFARFLFLMLFFVAPPAFSSAAERTELAERDVTTRPGWTGADASLFGVHVGQTRVDAAIALGKHRLVFVDRNSQRPDGKLFDVLSGKSFVGISFHVVDDRIFDIIVANEAQFDKPQAVLARRIQGRLLQLLFDYSDASRVSLIGEPDRVNRDPRAAANGADFVDYYYDRRGVGVLVQRSAAAKARDKGEAAITLVLSAAKDVSAP